MTSQTRSGVVVAQLGARRHYAVGRALHSSGVLDRLVTDACADVPPWSWLDAMLPLGARPASIRRLLGRHASGIPRGKIRGMPWFTLSSSFDVHPGESATDRWARQNARFGRLVVQSGLLESGTVYAYNGAALEIFRHAKERGLGTVLDQTSAPWRWNARLLREEAARWAGWEAGSSEIDESGQLSRREEAEWALADRIICGSRFVVDALGEQGGPKDRCIVVPYAAPEYSLPTDGASRTTTERDRPLRVLFVGTLQLRKGVQYLLAAARMLPKHAATIRMVGPSFISADAIAGFRDDVEVTGPVPRSEIQKHYDWADVLVLPTLSEGSANVVVEAMAKGLPVVTTSNAGSMVRDGENGILIPIRDAQALAAAILRLAHDAPLRARLAAAAVATMPGFDAYASRLTRAVAGEG